MSESWERRAEGLDRRIDKREQEHDELAKEVHEKYTTKEEHADLRRIIYWLVGTFITVVSTIFVTSVRLKFGG